MGGHDRDRTRPLRILHVEDNPADALLIREAFACGELHWHIHAADNGRDALRFLRRDPLHADAQRPDIILLDLNLPGMSGLDVLSAVKAAPTLCDIPVLILSTSSDARDVRAAYRSHAAGYMVKPMDFRDLKGLIRAIEGFWGRAVLLPPPIDGE